LNAKIFVVQIDISELEESIYANEDLGYLSSRFSVREEFSRGVSQSFRQVCLELRVGFNLSSSW